MPEPEDLVIRADFRERPSGITEMIKKSHAGLILETLETGDYLINDEVLIERKTKEDFVQSLVQNRLFEQCSRLRKTPYNHLLIIEGNPYKTSHKISREAIRGALISITVAWQIPILFSQDPADTFNILMMAGNQSLTRHKEIYRKGVKPKKMKNKQLFFLQGLPLIGPSLSQVLLKHFGTLENIVKAPFEELVKVPGIGIKKAKDIRKFLDKGHSI